MADVFTCFREAAIPFIDVAFTKQLYMKLNEIAEGEEEKKCSQLRIDGTYKNYYFTPTNYLSSTKTLGKYGML